MPNKKKKFIIITIIFVFLITSIIIFYDINAAVYNINQGGIEINGERYNFHQGSWRHCAVDERIGFIDGEPSFGRIFFHFLPNGLYSVKDDEQNFFFQPVKFFASMDYNLLVREDIELTTPQIDDILRIEFNGRTINNSSTIADFMNFYYEIGEHEAGTMPLPARVFEMQIYSKSFPGIYYSVRLYQAQNSSDYWLDRNNSERIKIPSGLLR
jgi:hypothetical protein